MTATEFRFQVEDLFNYIGCASLQPDFVYSQRATGRMFNNLAQFLASSEQVN